MEFFNLLFPEEVEDESIFQRTRELLESLTRTTSNSSFLSSY
jgi:hypothetical protein